MNAHTTPINPLTKANGASRKGRISPRVRLAITLRVEKGLTHDAAAKAAGLSPAGYYKAMLRQNVKDLAEQIKLDYIARVLERKTLLKARALEVAEELLTGAASEAVRARMVEFLAGEDRSGPLVNVNIGEVRGGYEFVKPGQRIVDIRPALDGASSDGYAQAIDDADILPDAAE